MNRIEIEIGGKLRAFRLGLHFLGEILNHFDTDISGLGSLMVTNPYKAVPAIIYFGHAYECKKSGKAIDFTILDCSEWVEELENTYSNEVIHTLTKVLVDSLRKNVPGYKLAEEANNAKEAKKK